MELERKREMSPCTMESFEAKLPQVDQKSTEKATGVTFAQESSTAHEYRDLLGAIGLIVNREGNVVYHYASGFQSLASDAPPIDPNSTFALGSAGKLITHIAALQCVERGLIGLDDPVETHLGGLAKLRILSRNEGPDDVAQPFLLRPSTKKITLRHLLTHSSGLCQESNPLIQEWRIWTGCEPKPDDHPSDQRLIGHDEYDNPLLFEPGEGWLYGANIGWTSVLIARLTKQRLEDFVQENIFDPLGMASATYKPQDHPELSARALQMVVRHEARLKPAKYPLRELICSVPDLANLLVDLISPSSKLLKPELQDLLFAPQFPRSSAALSYIRRDTENYAAPAGIPTSMSEAPVNHSLAALVVQEQLPFSHMPAGTVTWNGMPNVIWAMHREQGLAMVFATQLLPVDDEKTVDIAMTFFRGAWDSH